LKSLRDPRAFAQCQRELEVLQKQEDQGRIDLYYFDEAGFTLDPYIPYAWQEPGTVIEIPAQKNGRMNVLGFLNRKNDLHPFIFEQSVHTGVVIACVEEFSKTLKKNGCCHQYLRRLSGVDSRVDPSQFSHLGHHLINKKGVGHCRKQF